jgi:hypothetical protein
MYTIEFLHDGTTCILHLIQNLLIQLGNVVEIAFLGTLPRRGAFDTGCSLPTHLRHRGTFKDLTLLLFFHQLGLATSWIIQNNATCPIVHVLGLLSLAVIVESWQRLGLPLCACIGWQDALVELWFLPRYRILRFEYRVELCLHVLSCVSSRTIVIANTRPRSWYHTNWAVIKPSWRLQFHLGRWIEHAHEVFHIRSVLVFILVVILWTRSITIKFYLF